MQILVQMRLAAQQLGLFTAPVRRDLDREQERKPEVQKPAEQAPAPGATKHAETVHVAAHIAKTEHGLVQVKAHDRVVQKRAEEPKPSKPAARADDLSSRKTHLDAGEVVKGARKHKYHHVDLSNIDALEAEGEVEAQKRVSKASAFGEPWTLEGLQESGDSPGAAYLKLEFQKLIPAKPEPTVQARRDYVRACEYVRRGLDQCHTAQEVTDWLTSFGIMARGHEPAKAMNDPDEVLAALGMKAGEHDDTYGGYTTIGDTRVGYARLRRMGISDILHQSMPVYGARGYEGQKRTWTILRSDESMRDTYGTMAEALGADTKSPVGWARKRRGQVRKPISKALAGSDGQWDPLVQGATYDRQPSQAWATLGAKAKEKGGERKQGEKWKRMTSADGIVRVGGAPVPEHVTGAELMQQFGFRGVQYGNWVNDQDAGKHLKECYGALSDLADVLGLDPKMIAHSGALAMAFGARGSGQFAAHYEPDKKVINLTHTNGDGSLAHEWGHFMDHILTASDKWVATGKSLRAPFLSHGEGHDTLHPEVATAMRGVIDAMNSSPTGGEALRARAEANQKAMAALRQEHHEVTKLPMGSPERIKAGDEYNRKRKEWMAEQKRIDQERSAFRRSGKALSQFAQHANVLGDYWARPHEMFARAFESYVQDKLESQGRRSTYLVDGTSKTYTWKGDAQPYPQGEERKAINQAMDKLFEAMGRHQTLKKALARLRRLDNGFGMPLRLGVLARLTKAQQLALFGSPAATKPVQVKAHTARTKSGKVVTVAAHQRHVRPAAEEPPPAPPRERTPAEQVLEAAGKVAARHRDLVHRVYGAKARMDIQNDEATYKRAHEAEKLVSSTPSPYSPKWEDPGLATAALQRGAMARGDAIELNQRRLRWHHHMGQHNQIVTYAMLQDPDIDLDRFDPNYSLPLNRAQRAQARARVLGSLAEWLDKQPDNDPSVYDKLRERVKLDPAIERAPSPLALLRSLRNTLHLEAQSWLAEAEFHRAAHDYITASTVKNGDFPEGHTPQEEFSARVESYFNDTPSFIPDVTKLVDRIKSDPDSYEGEAGGHWGSAFEKVGDRVPMSTYARDFADAADDGWLRNPYKGMEPVKTGSEFPAAPAVARAVYAQAQVKKFPRSQYPTVWRGMQIPESTVRDIVWSLEHGHPPAEVPLTGCSAFTFFESVASRYTASTWTQEKSAIGSVPVKLVVKRNDTFDKSIGMWHHAFSEDKAEKYDKKKPAFEILSTAKGMRVTKAEKVGNVWHLHCEVTE